MLRQAGDLGAHQFTFAVISDTHVNAEEDHCNSPFPVNARANRRFRHVIADLNQRDIEFVVHLGDLVHPVPETRELYTQAATAFRAIEADLRVPAYHVPGNHDIGDTPVKGAPASPTTQPMIDAWTKEFGAQWQAFSHEGVRFVLLNVQLVNSGLPDETLQKEWAEAELAAAPGRVILMLHHPPYLCFPEEPNHYDNTDPPGRAWLLGLMADPKVETVFAGHAHNFWYDRYQGADFFLAPSTCFIRQDYSEMFRAVPPDDSEYGRDDKAKLGYLIVKVYETGQTVQFVRTNGAELSEGDSPATATPLAPTPIENSDAAVGFDLRRNWADLAEVPPSGGLDEFDRKIVRNDYPLLALIEMGIRNIRIPLADLRDPMRRDRLKALCHLGFQPTLFGFGVPADHDMALAREMKSYLADWEMTVDWPPSQDLIGQVAKSNQDTGLPIFLSRLRSKADMTAGSTYYHVINHGFAPDDETFLEELAELKSSGVVGAVFRLGAHLNIGETLLAIDEVMKSRGMIGSAHLRTAGENPAEPEADPQRTEARVAEALDQLSSLKATRIFYDTLADNDRGYFPHFGAIDSAGNPRKLARIIKSAHAFASNAQNGST